MAARLDFDVDTFLQRPLLARVATTGPTLRPVWFLWEERARWWLTGPWSSLEAHLANDPRVYVLIDTCDLKTGETKHVRLVGHAEVLPYDHDRALRKLRRYLGSDENAWDPDRFAMREDDDVTRFVRLRPQRVEALDLSFVPSLDQ
jgi:hypothetical protein